jgi:hypothetical protein
VSPCRSDKYGPIGWGQVKGVEQELQRVFAGQLSSAAFEVADAPRA